MLSGRLSGGSWICQAGSRARASRAGPGTNGLVPIQETTRTYPASRNSPRRRAVAALVTAHRTVKIGGYSESDDSIYQSLETQTQEEERGPARHLARGLKSTRQLRPRSWKETQFERPIASVALTFANRRSIAAARWRRPCTRPETSVCPSPVYLRCPPHPNRQQHGSTDVGPVG